MLTFKVTLIDCAEYFIYFAISFHSFLFIGEVKRKTKTQDLVLVSHDSGFDLEFCRCQSVNSQRAHFALFFCVIYNG